MSGPWDCLHPINRKQRQIRTALTAAISAIAVLSYESLALTVTELFRVGTEKTQSKSQFKTPVVTKWMGMQQQ